MMQCNNYAIGTIIIIQLNIMYVKFRGKKSINFWVASESSLAWAISNWLIKAEAHVYYLINKGSKVE